MLEQSDLEELYLDVSHKIACAKAHVLGFCPLLCFRPQLQTLHFKSQALEWFGLLNKVSPAGTMVGCGVVAVNRICTASKKGARILSQCCHQFK